MADLNVSLECLLRTAKQVLNVKLELTDFAHEEILRCTNMESNDHFEPDQTTNSLDKTDLRQKGEGSPGPSYFRSD